MYARTVDLLVKVGGQGEGGFSKQGLWGFSAVALCLAAGQAPRLVLFAATLCWRLAATLRAAQLHAGCASWFSTARGRSLSTYNGHPFHRQRETAMTQHDNRHSSSFFPTSQGKKQPQTKNRLHICAAFLLNTRSDTSPLLHNKIFDAAETTKIYCNA